MNREHFEKRFDLLFEQAVRKSADLSPPANSKASWENVRMRIELDKRKRLWRRRMKFVGTAAVFMLIGALVFGGSQITNASASVFKLLRQFQGKVATLMFGDASDQPKGAKTPPPPGESAAEVQTGDSGASGILRRERFTSLEAVSGKIAFHLFVPRSLPKEYELDRVDLYSREQDSLADEALLRYIKPDSRSFLIIQKLLDANAMLSTSVDESTGTVKETNIDGRKAFLVLFTDGRTKLESLIGSVHIEIIGDLSAEEAESVARSLK